MSAGGLSQSGTALNSTEIYNSTSRTWSLAPSMSSHRALFTLTPVFNGTRTLLAVGGIQARLPTLPPSQHHSAVTPY